MRKGRDGKRKEKRKEKKKKKRMAFLVATMSLPAVYHPNDDARTTTAGTPHARAKNSASPQKGKGQRWVTIKKEKHGLKMLIIA